MQQYKRYTPSGLNTYTFLMASQLIPTRTLFTSLYDFPPYYVKAVMLFQKCMDLYPSSVMSGAKSTISIINQVGKQYITRKHKLCAYKVPPDDVCTKAKGCQH